MKKILTLPALLFVCILHATTYYSTNNTAPNLTTSWHTSRSGFGFMPGNFTGGDIFVIQAGQYLTTTASWTVSGSNATLIIETGATLQADDKVSVLNFEIDGTGTYIHNKNGNSFPGSDTRTFAATSTVEIRDWSGSAALPDPTTWGNLIINVAGYGSSLNQAGSLTSVAGNLVIRNTGTGTNEFRLAAGQDYTLTIGGNLVIESGILEAAQNNGNHDQEIIINGSFIQSGGTFVRSNNNANTLKVEFNGTNSAFTKSGGTLTNTYVDWIVNASKKLTLNNNLSIASARSLTVNGSIDCGTNQVTGAGSFSLASTGCFITSSTSGIDGAIVVTGSEVYNSGSSYEFDAATTAPFPASVATVTATNVVIDANLTLNKNVTVTGNLNLVAGKLTIPAGNTLTVSSGSVITGSGFGTSKQIVTQVNTSTGAKGMLRITNLSGTATLPIGTGTYYMPVILTVAGANDFSVAVFQGATTNGTPNGTLLTSSQKSSMIDANWIINRNSGTNLVTMQLAWPTALEGSQFPSLADNQIGIAHNGGYWESPLGSGSQASNTATRSGITNFSPFGVGKIGIPLPLKFGDFKVYEKTNGDLDIDWTGYSDIDLNHFEIERSSTGQQFTSIGKVIARNQVAKTDYTWTDSAPLKNVSFYRINAIDIDGKSNYSTIVRFDFGKTNSGLTLFPNPVIDKKISLQ
ncbi:MAG TPA: hypothetical protein VK588_12410, partial [Chitinophagaceae bacterium]|nr:hypothetical protein [Chitinophagaceae bacterium]